MTPSLRDVQRTLTDFLSGAPFVPLWQAVMDATEQVDADETLSDRERDWFDELYDLVYMAGEDPVDARSRDDDIPGAQELRAEIRALHLDSPDRRPA